MTMYNKATCVAITVTLLEGTLRGASQWRLFAFVVTPLDVVKIRLQV